MRALQFSEFGPVSNLRLVELPEPRADPATAVVKIAAASINPGDVKNVEGKMEHTTLPRIPGRDYAGTVVAGPKEWIGVDVWGTVGEIDYSIDGSHADLIAVPIASLRRKPQSLSMEQAAAIGASHTSPHGSGLSNMRVSVQARRCWLLAPMAVWAAPQLRSANGAAHA